MDIHGEKYLVWDGIYGILAQALWVYHFQIQGIVQVPPDIMYDYLQQAMQKGGKVGVSQPLVWI